MSQLILDDHLDVLRLAPKIRKWSKVSRLADLRPHEHILDERIPEILLTLKTPTFVTIDQGFWDRELCHPGYSVIVFPIQDKEQQAIPSMLRALFRFAEFGSRSARMGKVARVSRRNIAYWEFREADLRILPWKERRKKRE